MSEQTDVEQARRTFEALNRATSYYRVGVFVLSERPGVQFVDWAHYGGERYHFPAALEAAIEQRVHAQYAPVVEALREIAEAGDISFTHYSMAAAALAGLQEATDA